MRKILLFIYVLFILFQTGAQEISISGNKFTTSGSEIWFTGINTPWHLFDDFGRNDFDPDWWSDEFARYKENHINLARVWIHGSGEVSPEISNSGYVSGVNDLFWEHMDHLMEVSRENEVYVMPALLSFDITKSTYPTHQAWRAWLQSPENVQSYIDNVLIPMVLRYENEPYLMAWEICNEPEWMFENPEHGPQSFSDVQSMHAMLAAAIHENSSKLVTTGSAAPKWNSPIYDHWGANEGNMFSDSLLSSSIGNDNAFLDFYQYHWYPWQSEYMGSPFTNTTAFYDVDDRPVIVGESEGNDVCDAYVCQTVSEMYESAYMNGFDAVCAWKTPQNDGHGTFENIALATNEFYTNHPNLVYPDGSDPVAVTGIALSETAISIEERYSHTLTATLAPDNATNKRVSWSSSNPSVATVVNGVVTGISSGLTTITVATNDGNFTAICEVTVTGRENGCTNSTVISLPFTHEGAGIYCWETSGTIEYINSWSVDYLEINGVNITNNYLGSMPERIGGKYYIFMEGSNSSAHVEIIGTNDDTGDIYYTLTTSVIGQGSVSPSDGRYEEDAEVSLTADPAEGYIFEGWSGDASGSSRSITIAMDSDKSVTAVFVEETAATYYTLTTTAIGQGTISGVDGSFLEGENVTLVAIPENGYVFQEWSGDANGTSETITITMDSDKSISATFVIDDTDEEICDNPTAVSLPLTLDGIGTSCWETTDEISFINSWNMGAVEINGVNFTNIWSSSMPPKIDGKYFIRYEASVGWAHLEIHTFNSSRIGISLSGSEKSTISLSPNPIEKGRILSIDLGSVKQPQNVVVHVYDLKGNLLLTKSTLSTELINIKASFSSGVYTVVISGNEQLLVTKRLIVH